MCSQSTLTSDEIFMNLESHSSLFIFLRYLCLYPTTVATCVLD